MSDLQSLGGRLKLIEPSCMSAEQKVLSEYMNHKMVPWAKESGFIARLEDGRFVGPFNGLLESPALSQAFLVFQGQEGSLTTLSQRIRQVIILTVGHVWNCDYERYAHAAVANQAGLSKEAIEALRNGTQTNELSENEMIAREFTRSITAQDSN